MIKGSKICGISDLDTLNFIINHPHPPKFIGFICNYKKSPRYVDIAKLNKLLKEKFLTIDNKKHYTSAGPHVQKLLDVQKGTLNNLSKLASRVYNISLMKND